MDLENPNRAESSVAKNSKPRRTFLIKASAVTVVASLPLGSSWARDHGTGCSVSGNLSGNLSRGCEEFKLKGKSPDEWLEELHSNDKNIMWSTVFGGGRGRFGGGSDKSIGWVLSKSSSTGQKLDAALLAAYLNAANGNYGTLTVSAQEYVQGLYDQVRYNEISKSKMTGAIVSTYSSSRY